MRVRIRSLCEWGRRGQCRSWRWLALACLLVAATLACSDLTDQEGGDTPDPAAPEYKLIPGIFAADGTLRDPTREFRVASAAPAAFRSWTRSHGDDFSSKYSSLEYIDRTNITSLDVAWRFDSSGGADEDGGERPWLTNVEANPIVAGHTLYAATPQNTLVALDATSGALRWEFGSTPGFRFGKEPAIARRGLLYWQGPGGARLYLPVDGHVIALDAETGSLVESFGEAGRIAALSTTAPAIVGDRLLVAHNLPPLLAAYDVASGAALWRTPLMKDAEGLGDPGGAPWGGFSVDAERGLAFVTTGNPRPAMGGFARPGANLYSNSVVAIRIADGQIVWHWQEVEHGLWNYDLAAPPVLTSIEIGGRALDVVAATTKIGNTLLLERDSGQPIFDYRLRRAPPSRAPGEIAATYQPDLELPEPFSRQAFTRDDITDIGEANRAAVLAQLDGADMGFFKPPIWGKLIAFGLHGGSPWSGAAMDHAAGVLYIPSNHLPWQLRGTFTTPNPVPMPVGPARELYRERCQRCHGPRREGRYEEYEGRELEFVPPLIGTSLWSPAIGMYDAERLTRKHATTDAPPFVQHELDSLYAWMKPVDRALSLGGKLRGGLDTNHLLDHEGYPASKPPWGTLAALDLRSGRLRWQVPFGEYPELTARGLAPTGQPNYGGAIVTAGGLVFATGTIDAELRAFDTRDGAELWSYRLPAAGGGPPMSYEIDGVQYVVVVASGGRFHNFTERASQIVAFALPRSARQP